MISHFIKIAFRTMWRQRSYSLINIISLALGLACCILILVYVRYELSYDQYHENKDRLYRMALAVEGTTYGSIAKVNGPWGLAVRDEVPEVDAMTRFVFTGSLLLGSGDRRFYEPDGFYADSSATTMFSYILTEGDPRWCLSEPNSIVLTETLSKKYFGDNSPLGQTLLMENSIPLRVTGVMRDVPLNSHFTFTYLLSMGTLTHPQRNEWLSWNQFYTYVLLRPGATISIVEEKMTEVIRRHLGEQGARFKLFLQPVTSIHLHSNLFREMEPNSDVSYIYLMSAVAFFLLLVGCVNFMNISTARASTRAKEVGIRKANGADRFAISRQFFGESLLQSVLSLPLAIALVEIGLPTFNTLTSRSITIHWMGDPVVPAGLVLLTLLAGLIAGIYPSLVLSSFNPVSVLQGERSGPRGAAFRKILVVAQFTLSAFFLIATGVVLRQLTYIQEKRLGFNEEQLIVIPMTHPSLHERTESIKAELLRHPSIVSVAATANLPGGGDWGIPYVPAGIPPEQIPPMRILVGDQDLITTLQIPLAQGRVFSRAIATDSTAAWIINEEAARQLGWEDPLQHRIAMPAVNRASAPVIGVVKDFHFRSLREKIVPILVMVPPREWLTSFAVRVRPGDVTETLAYLERQFKEYDPQHPFRYSFLDEQFSNLHASEQRMGHLLTVTSVLAIVLACLGLFGLAAFSAEIRTKEIGVRKVMGASLPGIVGLMTRDFMKLVFVANVLAWPLGYYAMTLWLESFAYRTDVSPWIFAATTLLAFVIAALTVSVQAVRAGLANPVEALRYE